MKFVTKVIINNISYERAVPTYLKIYIARFSYQNNLQKYIWRTSDNIYITGSWVEFRQSVVDYF